MRLTTAELGLFAEDRAATFLLNREIEILARNFRVGGGEIDLVARINRRRTAIEVRSIRQTARAATVAIDAFDADKARQVRRVAVAAGCRRIDLISVCFHSDGIDLHWVPEVA